MYSRKTIQNLKPDLYLKLSRSEKLKEQERLRDEIKKMWNEKPKPLLRGATIVANSTRKSITENKRYKVKGYFATLVTTIYYSEWHQFVTLKNDDGWTVKMNLNNFRLEESERKGD